MKFLLSFIILVLVLTSFSVVAIAPADGSVWLSKPYTGVGINKSEVENNAMLINTNYAVDVYAKMPENFDNFALDIAYGGSSAFYASDKFVGVFVPAAVTISDFEKEGTTNGLNWIMVGGIVNPVAAVRSTNVKLGTLYLQSPAARRFSTQLVPSIQGVKEEMVLTKDIRTEFRFVSAPAISVLPPNGEPVADRTQDLDGNSEVEMEDVFVLARFVLLNEGTDYTADQVDFSGDGRVDIDDVFALARVVLGI